MAASQPSILSATSLPSSISHGIYLGPSLRHGACNNDVASNFWSDCLSFSICATATIAITTANLISDWLLLRLLKSTHIPGYNNLSRYNTDSDFALHLQPDPTSVLHIIVIISTVIYCGYFLWFLYMFSIQRSMLKDRWDGLPTKNNCFVKFGGEIFTFFLTVAQDIPVSTLLFVVQAAASCDLIIITENAIFLLATSLTLISVIWKAGQVVWNSGCCGFRFEYLTSTGLIALRWSTILTLAAAFALSTCNIVLLIGWKSSTISTRQLSNTIMDKVGVDRWWRQESVILVAGRAAKVTNISGPPHLNSVVEVVSMRNVVKPDEPELFTISVIPCQSHNYDFTQFLQSDHQNIDYEKCTIYFNFNVLSDAMTIRYDFRYMLQKQDSCWSGVFQKYLHLQQVSFSNNTNDSSDLSDSAATSDKEAFTATTSNVAGTSYASQTPLQQPFHSVMLDSYMWKNNRFSCKYVLIRDTTLLDRQNICR